MLFFIFSFYWCIGAIVQDLRDQATSASAAIFVTALVFNAIIFGAEPSTLILTSKWFSSRECMLFLPNGIFLH